ncbi:LysR family transcriptional regulator [Lutimaribacter saemankumensis]|uniref:DNA-binding transcriptional regulator, LysR family n=1 Tax=Lutimaribacter saemankumensis TaxID=490829 RepID=A0A1G8T5K9_9RHOB|nr:LysR family transcriptional regulator [Lutimaribacter saemankumensis]SDJ36868.1 DNA-binding transcriptional regulator, LysR family [Lutimaribacter saemankumensis]
MSKKAKAENELDLYERFPRQLDWNLLRTYIAIVDAQGIRRASEALHLTQPAVSQALKRLEGHLGQTLIKRNARRFEVTTLGKLVYQKAQEIHNSIARLGPLTAGAEVVLEGHVRLLLASRVKSKMLDEVLRDFHNANPRVTLRIDVMPSADIRAQVRQGAAGLGLCLLRGRTLGLKSELFLRQRFGLFCGRTHPLYGQTNLTPDALKSLDFISYPSDQIGGVLSPLAMYREKHVFEGRLRATSTNLDEIIRMTELGLGIGLLPMHLASALEQAGILWRLPPYNGIGPIDMYLIWNPATEYSEAETALIAAFRSRRAKEGGAEIPNLS